MSKEKGRMLWFAGDGGMISPSADNAWFESQQGMKQ
jgi:hypothetical protein